MKWKKEILLKDLVEVKNKMGSASKVFGGVFLGMFLGAGAAITAMVTSQQHLLHEPTREEFKTSSLNLENKIISDVDGDGGVDLIVDKDNNYYVSFYSLDLENKANCRIRPGYSYPMSSNLEETATALLKNSQEFKYQEAKARYDSMKKVICDQYGIKNQN